MVAQAQAIIDKTPRWAAFAQKLGRAPVSVGCRWSKPLDPYYRRHEPWTDEEDNALLRDVINYKLGGKKVSWKALSKIYSRPPPSLKDRWYHVVDPTLRTDPWTPQEDDIICLEGLRAWKANEAPRWEELELRLGKSVEAIDKRWLYLLHRHV
ncbi:hypothetical protein HDV00_005067 [Rhizophlyctis rosea]|nr:hypothetical protein HDV00_005067 [Rhizophlyctis rosea]